MPDPNRGPFDLNLGAQDVAGGVGPHKIVRTDDLAVPMAEAPSAPVSGAGMVGYHDTAPLIGADNVQAAIDALKASGSASPFVATNEFWIDNTIVDSPVNEALREFSLISLALAAINGGSVPAGLPFVLRVREGQTHLWDGTGYLGDRQGTLYTVGGNTPAVIDPAGIFTMPVSGNLTFRNLILAGAGNTYNFSAADTTGIFEDCLLTGGGTWAVGFVRVLGGEFEGSVTINPNGFFEATNNAHVQASSITAGIDGIYQAVNARHSEVVWTTGAAWNVTILGGVIQNTLTDGTIVFGGPGPANVAVTLTGVTLIADLPGAFEAAASYFQAADVTLNDVSIVANLTHATSELNLFQDPGTGTTATLNDIQLSYNGPGTMNYEQGGVTTTNNGFVVVGPAIANQPSGTWFNNGLGFVAVQP